MEDQFLPDLRGTYENLVLDQCYFCCTRYKMSSKSAVLIARSAFFGDFFDVHGIENLIFCSLNWV